MNLYKQQPQTLYLSLSMTILEAKPNMEVIATPGRFFIEKNHVESAYPENPQAVYWHDEMFWLKHCDDLGDKPVTVLQTGMNEEGLTSLSEPHDRVITLVFDSSKRHAAKFTWELICANVQGTREVFRLDVSQTNLQARLYEYDVQGVKRNVSQVDPAQIAHTISKMTSSEMLAQKVAELAEKRVKSEAELAELAVSGIQRYSAAFHQKKIEHIEERISKIGFTATTLQT